MEADLSLAALADDAKFKRDAVVLGEDASIEQRRAKREEDIAKMEIEGAGAAAADAAEARARAIEGTIALGGDIASQALKLDKTYGWGSLGQKPTTTKGKNPFQSSQEEIKKDRNFEKFRDTGIYTG